MPTNSDNGTEAPMGELARDALDGVRELVRLEVMLAKDELRDDLGCVKRSAIGFAVAVAFAITTLSMLGVAVVLAAGASAPAALVVALACAVVSGAAAFAGYKMAPNQALGNTRRRLDGDVRELKEHAA